MAWKERLIDLAKAHEFFGDIKPCSYTTSAWHMFLATLVWMCVHTHHFCCSHRHSPFSFFRGEFFHQLVDFFIVFIQTGKKKSCFFFFLGFNNLPIFEYKYVCVWESVYLFLLLSLNKFLDSPYEVPLGSQK
jgi:hypothetical protein